MIEILQSYIWYRFDFEYTSRLTKDGITTRLVESQTADIFNLAQYFSDKLGNRSTNKKYGTWTGAELDNMNYDEIIASISPADQAYVFRSIYMQLLESPSADLPYTGDLPRADNYPNVTLPNMANWIDMTDHPDDGAFTRAFSRAFDIYTGD